MKHFEQEVWRSNCLLWHNYKYKVRHQIQDLKMYITWALIIITIRYDEQMLNELIVMVNGNGTTLY